MSLMGGRKLVSVGDYKFTGKRLGKGNFAMVEEATHTILNIKVAIKIMDVRKIQEEYVIRNLYREAKIMSKLSHPCIASLFQTMQHGNMYYLVTELVSGGDLCNYIRGQRYGKLEEPNARIFVRQLVSAISHMHNLGIVHRDLKMENVMLCPTNDRIKIVDFGLSNSYSGDELLHTHCGSPEYAAPELFVEGKLYGPEVDLWSLGVILYGMVVGQLPFVSNVRDAGVATQRRKKLLEQINRGLSPAHRKALALFTPDFKTMMGKLLVADSSKRINITELIIHPWVTEKGRKIVRTNPFKKLDDNSKSNIIKDVAMMTHTNLDEVQDSLQLDPHGNFAGMYNLLAHRATFNHLDGDMVILKTVTPSHYNTPRNLTSRCVTDSSRYSKVKTPLIKRQDITKSAPAPKSLKKPEAGKVNTYTGRYSETARCAGDETSHKYSKRLSLNENLLRTRKPIHIEPIPRVSRAPTKEQQKGIINMGSPKNVGKNLQTRPENLCVGNVRRSAAGDSFREEEDGCMFDKLKLHSPPPPALSTRSRKSKIESIVEQAFAKTSPPNGLMKRTNRTSSGTMQHLNNPQVHVDQHMNVSPLTTTPRPVKRKSMLPVMQLNKDVTNIIGVQKSAPLKSRLHELTKCVPPVNKLDDSKRLNAATNRKIDLTNEPIARSIAGYLTKNITNTKIGSIKWIKGANANFGT